MADWIKVTDLAPATSGGAAVPQDHFLNLDSVLAISYREPAPHQGQAAPVAEVYIGAQLPIRLFSEEARDQLRRALDQRAGDATTRGAYSPAGSRRAQQSSTEE
jgi:hypothetical protein